MGGTNEMTAKNQRTVGEIVELARQLKELGVIRAKADGIEFEFAFFQPSPEPSKFMDPEELEEEAKKIRKKLQDELFEAS